MDLPARIGRYDVELLLGEGGMGRVLLARDTVLGRQVALKILRDDLGLPSELRAQLVERLRQEARAAATVSHPSMVTLHDMGEDEQVGLFLVFELIKGPTLRERLQQGPLPPGDVAALARALGSALAHAHAAGVLHRDVKPENVMLAATGPKLTDFGIARLPDSTLTRATTVLGTPAYSAPEALASGAFSAQSDQFSLAATLYEALTGMRAFPGDDALAVATSVATGKHKAPTTALPSLARFVRLDVIFDRALAKDPRARFASCEAFGNALATELEGSALVATPLPSRASIIPRSTRRWQNAAAAAAVGVIFALVVAGRMQRDAGDGVSLEQVAHDFAVTVGSRAASIDPSHHAHATSAAGAATAATPTASAASIRLDAGASPDAVRAAPSASAPAAPASAPRVDP